MNLKSDTCMIWHSSHKIWEKSQAIYFHGKKSQAIFFPNQSDLNEQLELVDQLSWARSISSRSWARHIGSETENKIIKLKIKACYRV